MALINQGDSLVNIGESEKAISLYKRNLNSLKKIRNITELTKIYNKIGAIHYKNKDYKLADKNYAIAFKNDTTTQSSAETAYRLFLVKRKLNEPDSIIHYLEHSLEKYKKLPNSYNGSNTFLTAGIIYKNKQQFDKSLQYLILSYKGFSELNETKKLGDVSITLGNVHNQLKNYEQALQYHYEALALQEKAKNEKGIARCYNNLANVYDNLELLDSAVINYKKSLNYLSPNTKQYGIALNNIANTYLKLNNTYQAKESYKKAINTNTVLKDTTALLYNYNGLTSLELKVNNLEASKVLLSTSSDLIKKNTDNIIRLGYYENNVEYYQKTRNYKSALEYQIKYSDLYKQIYNKEQTEIVQEIQSKFEYEKKENEILRLNLSNKSKQLELAEKNKALGNKNTILIILSSVIFIALVGFYAFVQKGRLKAQKVKHEKLKAIYNGQETIKKRIARDLHDIITTNFDGLRLKILALKKTPNPNQLIEDTTNELKNINRQIRIVSHRLSPLEMQMSHQKFTEVIRSRLSEFHLYGKVFVELEEQLPNVLNELDLVIQNNFYGILLEILNNVEKHSHATKLNINHFTDEDNKLHFIFNDNGIGIDKDFKEGIGLLNIRQRCEIIGGECIIEKVNSGTQVSINFPIKIKK